ncbi:hypothetical protein F2Q69_00003793 [Brassica cretica]|uniref:Uncharacterized protein n=1 Tax=Brassica cretica TaxID=69181 RepID=A0A8S9PKK4_BRACR|nr:hypothetical protein F2Q69_00003793 [Brassica cretica]
MDKRFEEAYFIHRIWMFLRETKETEEYIRRMFHQVREKMRQRITLKKNSDSGKFMIPCLIGGIDNPSAHCNTGSSVNILPSRNSEGFVRNLEVQISNAIVPVNFYVLDIKFNLNSSLLLGRAVMATVGAATWRLEMFQNSLQFSRCDHEAEVESEIETSIDTQPEASIDQKSEAAFD